MKDKDFTQVSVFARELESQLLSEFSFRSASQGETLQKSLNFFEKYDHYDFHGSETLAEIDEVLMEKLESCYSTLYDLIPHPAILDILAVRYEFESLKTALFNCFSSTPVTPLYPRIGSIHPDEYAAFLEHRDPFETFLPDHLLKPAQSALKRIDLGESPSSALDQLPKNMFARMLELAEIISNDFITDTIRTMIDFHNTLTLLKIKTSHLDPSTLETLLVENGKTSPSFFSTGLTRSLSAAVPAVYHKQFSKEIETTANFFIKKDDFDIWNHLFRHIQVTLIKKADLVDYGPEVPFSFIIKKEDEINQIRTVLYGKEKNLDHADIIAKLFV